MTSDPGRGGMQRARPTAGRARSAPFIMLDELPPLSDQLLKCRMKPRISVSSPRLCWVVAEQPWPRTASPTTAAGTAEKGGADRLLHVQRRWRPLDIVEAQEGSDSCYTLLFANGAFTTLSDITDNQLTWFSDASGTTLECARLFGE